MDLQDFRLETLANQLLCKVFVINILIFVWSLSRTPSVDLSSISLQPPLLVTEYEL